MILNSSKCSTTILDVKSGKKEYVSNAQRTSTSMTMESAARSNLNAEFSTGQSEFVKAATKDGNWKMENALQWISPIPITGVAKLFQMGNALNALRDGTEMPRESASQSTLYAEPGQKMEIAKLAMADTL